MNRRSKASAQRVWSPLRRAEKIPPPASRVTALRAEAVARGLDPDGVDRAMAEAKELWRNDLYTVHVLRREDGSVHYLSIRRNDREPDMPWRHLQRIKNELAGDDAEAVELFPAEARLVDTANQRWLWCLPPGERFPMGFDAGRVTSTPAAAHRVGARQS